MNSVPLLKKSYRNIFIVDALSSWAQHANAYNSATDLVLTYDFGLRKYIQGQDGEVSYIDHLADAQRMHTNNFRVFEFLNNWHLTSDGQDLFTYKGVPFGFSFRLDIWNDLVYCAKLHLCLSALKPIEYQALFVSSEDERLHLTLDTLTINYVVLPCKQSGFESYYFPIAKYMNDRLRATGIRGVLYKSRYVVTALFGLGALYFDKFIARRNKKTVFIQEYHPTKALLSSLRDKAEVKVLLANFSRGSKLTENLSERLLPIYGRLSKFDTVSQELLTLFSSQKQAKLIFDDGSDMTNAIYQIIGDRVKNAINEKLRILESCINYIDRNHVDLSVLIANIGLVPTLFDCVCRTRDVPSYLIINGILGAEYSDDSKYATVINSYSHSIKKNYFKGMDNIVTLGDPRMDLYPPLSSEKILNRAKPTIVIGASGFSPVDLNSYVAIEFDFMSDVLSALKKIRESGGEITIIIKVRPNGYKQQYSKFVEEFFPNLVDEIIDNQSMLAVLNRADFYISINSQTLFEASCLGIPVLYYKNDCEVMPPPFDNQSELVTVTNIDDLVSAFYDYQNSAPRYDDFLKRSVMEKYIGPLDGKNLQRNYDHVLQMLGERNAKFH
jgi:hypothetical protein